MKTILALALTLASAVAEGTGSWTGVITDSMCVGNHSMMNSKGPADACTRACVKSNPSTYKYVLFDGKNQYKLSDQQSPAAFAGKKVKVTGTLYEKTGIIKVDSIEAAK